MQNIKCVEISFLDDASRRHLLAREGYYREGLDCNGTEWNIDFAISNSRGTSPSVSLKISCDEARTAAETLEHNVFTEEYVRSLVERAVLQDPPNILYVPEDFLTAEMLAAAVDYDREHETDLTVVLRSRPETLRYFDVTAMLDRFFIDNSCDLSVLPPKERTEERAMMKDELKKAPHHFAVIASCMHAVESFLPLGGEKPVWTVTAFGKPCSDNIVTTADRLQEHFSFRDLCVRNFQFGAETVIDDFEKLHVFVQNRARNRSDLFRLFDDELFGHYADHVRQAFYGWRKSYADDAEIIDRCGEFPDYHMLDVLLWPLTRKRELVKELGLFLSETPVYHDLVRQPVCVNPLAMGVHVSFTDGLDGTGFLSLTVNDTKTDILTEIVLDERQMRVLPELLRCQTERSAFKPVRNDGELFSGAPVYAVDTNGRVRRMDSHEPSTQEELFIDISALTDETAARIVMHDPESGQYLPRERLDAIYAEILKENPSFLNQMPTDHLTEENCLIAVQTDGEALRFLDPSLRTEKVCAAAVRENGCALQYVGKDCLTENLCLSALRDTCEAMQYIPKERRTPEICDFYWRNYGLAALIPERFKDSENIPLPLDEMRKKEQDQQVAPVL